MGITVSNKEISTASIECGESLNVRLSLTAEPDIVSNPTDIVLILDRSQSMSGSPMANLKNGADKFIDIIDEATDGSQDGQIGGGSHIGIVSFATAATQDTQLITSVANLKSAVNALTAGGSTNHSDAFTKAVELFDPASANAKVMVMFTDGVTTQGPNPSPIAQAAKAQGITIYCIGLSGNGGIDVQALTDWASEPASSYVAITPDDEELENLFEDLAKNIAKPGATDIVLTDKISPCFKITSISSPDKGTASLIDSNTVQWKIPELGVSASEGGVFEFTVQHSGNCAGDIPVNESTIYSDNEKNVVSFPSPLVNVTCGDVVIPEECPNPVKITVNGCEDTVEFDAGYVQITSQGCILQLDVTLRNVCPNRRTALAVILTEVDCKDNEHQRGIKCITVPAHRGPQCQDVTVKCIKFVLPADLNANISMCSSRCFKARFIANYIDSGFDCCKRN